jgi:hypothetical protein
MWRRFQGSVTAVSIYFTGSIIAHGAVGSFAALILSVGGLFLCLVWLFQTMYGWNLLNRRLEIVKQIQKKLSAPLVERWPLAFIPGDPQGQRYDWIKIRGLLIVSVFIVAFFTLGTIAAARGLGKPTTPVQTNAAQQVDGVKDWIDVLSALLTPTIAILGSFIAYEQWRTNRGRLKHELFNRRYEVYQSIARFMAKIVQTGKVEPGEDIVFLVNTKMAYFLFDKEVSEVTRQIYKKAADLYALVAVQGQVTGDDLTKNVKKQRELVDWFSDELGKIEARFDKFLRLSH